MSKHHAGAGRYREALEKDESVPVVCAYTHWGPCGPGPLQAEHVIELADAPWQKADDSWKVWACPKHNREKADRAKAARKGVGMATASRPPKQPAGATGGGKAKGGATAVPQEGRSPVRLWGGVGFIALALAYWFHLLDWALARAEVFMSLLLGCAALVGAWAAWRYRARLLAAKRAETLARQAEGIARILPGAVPDAVRIEPRGRGAWQDGVLIRARIHLPPAVRIDDSKVREALHQYLQHAVGQPLVLDWRAWEKAVDYRPGMRVQPRSVEPEAPRQAEAHEAVRANLSDSLQKQFKDPEIKVTVTETAADSSPTAIRIFYGVKFPDAKDTARGELLAAVAAKTGERWRPTWQPPVNVVLLVKRPRMPAFVANPMPDIWETSPAHKFPIGVDEHGEIVWWDVLDAAHALIAGGTGSGKTVLLQALIWWASVQGWEIMLIDPKGTGLGGLRRLPGIKYVALADAEPMAGALEAADIEMRWRYGRVLDGLVDFTAFAPRLVVVDEVAELVTLIKRWWSGTKEKGDPTTHPSLEAIASIPRLGRECNVFQVAGIQQAAAGFFDGTEARDNYGFRAGCGPQSGQAADMLFGRRDIGRDVPQEAKGRATYALKQADDGTEMQVFWTPTLLPGGQVKPRSIKDKEPHPDDVAHIERMWEAVRRAAAKREKARAQAAVESMDRHLDGEDTTKQVERPTVTVVQRPPQPRRRPADARPPVRVGFLRTCIINGTPARILVDGEAVHAVAVEDDETTEGHVMIKLRDGRDDEQWVSFPEGEMFEQVLDETSG